ncbi:NAD(P)-dependent oxidoreductase [soil metagenome]
MTTSLVDKIESEEALEDILATPSAALVEDMKGLDGDILLLGAGGKMGPSLARLARRAAELAGGERRIIAASRFSSAEAERDLQASGVTTIKVDLLDDAQLRALPDVPNILYLVGMKFGTTGQEHLTWAMNAYPPGRVAERFCESRIVAFSTGNVYPLTPVLHGGPTEAHPTGPVGEYAQSCLGRERIFEHFSLRYGTPLLHYRLNYAIDLRYGVLLEVARAVKEGKPINLRMGHVNVIWQGDANEIALRALRLCASPAKVLNVTGPETVSVRWLAERFAELLGREPVMEHEEGATALLSNASQAHLLFGYPKVPLRKMIAWTAHWVSTGGGALGKPTHFQEREGKF